MRRARPARPYPGAASHGVTRCASDQYSSAHSFKHSGAHCNERAHGTGHTSGHRNRDAGGYNKSQLAQTIRFNSTRRSCEHSLEAGRRSGLARNRVWLVSERKMLTRIDPKSNKIVAQINLQRDSASAMTGFGSVWVTNTGEYDEEFGGLQRIDPLTNRVVATITLRVKPRFLAVGEQPC